MKSWEKIFQKATTFVTLYGLQIVPKNIYEVIGGSKTSLLLFLLSSGDEFFLIYKNERNGGMNVPSC